MNFKTKSAEAQYGKLPKILRKICEEFDAKSKEMGIHPVITRVADSVPGESGVHRQYRAVDIRDQFNTESFVYTEEQRNSLIEFINTKYARKDKYLTCYYHSFNGAPFHFHIQIPANPEIFVDPEVVRDCF